MKAIGNFIFAGSASIGVMQTGKFDIERVLEISDDIVKQNAKHFIHNYPHIPVVTPNTWETEGYLEDLGTQDYDLLYSNCPCSGLSQINKNASADNKANVHFFRTFDNINTIKPKAFIIENAPTLIALGYPLIKEMYNKLGESYKFTVIRDMGGNHDVPMQRARTFLVGWRRDIFKTQPILQMNKKQKYTVCDLLTSYDDLIGPNNYLVEDRLDKDFEQWFHHLPQGKSIRRWICENWSKYEPLMTEKQINGFATMKYKFDNNMSYWDKSPAKVKMDHWFPSMASVVNIIHPLKDRQLFVGEYAAIMGYPQNFEFVKDAEVPIIQAISQGVPVNFFKYIADEVGEALLGNRPSIEDDGTELLFQHHIYELYREYDKEEIFKSSKLIIDKKTPKTKKLEL